MDAFWDMLWSWSALHIWIWIFLQNWWTGISRLTTDLRWIEVWLGHSNTCSCFWTTPVQLWQYAFYNWTSTMFSSLKQAFFLDSAVHLGPPIFAIISPDQLHQHLSTSWLCGWCFQGDEQCWVFIKCSALNRGQKDPVWTHSYREPFSVCLGCSLTNAILTWSVTFGEIISLISPEWVVECL